MDLEALIENVLDMLAAGITTGCINTDGPALVFPDGQLKYDAGRQICAVARRQAGADFPTP